MHTEREIIMPKLFFKDENSYVVIGVNHIQKQVYEANKQTFDSIIELGDVAWNQILNQNDITRFLIGLNKV